MYVMLYCFMTLYSLCWGQFALNAPVELFGSRTVRVFESFRLGFQSASIRGSQYFEAHWPDRVERCGIFASYAEVLCHQASPATLRPGYRREDLGQPALGLAPVRFATTGATS